MERKIKIHLLFNEFPLTNQMYIYEMVKHLGKESSLDVCVLCNQSNSVDSSVEIVQKPKKYLQKYYKKGLPILKPKYKGLSFFEIKSLEQNADIIHLHHSFLLNRIENILHKENVKPKIIVTLRGSDTYIKPWYFNNWKRFYNEIIPKVDALLVQSEHQKEYLKNWGIQEQKILIIPSTIKKVYFKPKKINTHKVKIVSSFRMCWEKSIDNNLRVVKHLVDMGYNVQYDIYGYGPDMGQVYYLVNEFNLNNYVNIKGKVDNNLYLEKLENYHIYLQLSIVESLSISVIEAQSRGIPAIVSNSSGIAETVQHEKSGFALPYFEIEAAVKSIIELITNPDKYYNFSQAAISYANAKYTTDIEVNKYLKLYKTIVENN